MSAAPVAVEIEAERLARLRLARTPRIGPVTFGQLLTRYGSARAAIDALPHLSRRNAAPLVVPPEDLARREMEAGDRLDARLILWGDEAYPRLLSVLDAPPPLLWTRGDAALLSQPTIAIVGARTASAGGLRIARGIAQQLGEAGHVVVSGLARGVDASAHIGALTTGTVAVLGGGIDDIYPPDNSDLYHRIVEQGCIVSESPVGVRAQAKDFPRRNRIISGLSRGVIVVEAELRSGSLITARLAAEQGRDVFAVPGSPLDPRARGPNDLLRQGAILCEGVEDVERAFQTLRRLDEPAEAVFMPVSSGEPDDDLIERIAALLSVTPVSRDDIARAAGVPISVANAALLELDLSGRARLTSGGLVSL